MLVLVLIVKLDSPGPAIHRRRVLGKGGTQFDAFKFRTMHINGDEILNQHPELKAQLERDHKLAKDPRITRCGVWMRKLSLDELPQLFNVMLGQMSLVGPRMISPRELVRYGEHADELLTVKPGITGLWQISGRSSLKPEDRVRLDMQFIRTRNAWTDFKLLLMTIPAVLRSRGAY
jgi:lipopolysaccharide/colanic/teichoic acid biosynthesis glycosyltransferase